MATCPECGTELGRANRCRECQWQRPGTGTRGDLRSDRRTDPQCDWLSRGSRCLMRGTVLYGAEGKESRYCGWHDEAKRNPRVAEDADEFAKWCLRLRARGYCGDRFEWSHAPPGWLFQLVTGGESAAPTPPRRFGCARTSCPYGWNGESVAEAFRAPEVKAATTPGPLLEAPEPADDPASEPVPIGAALPAWIHER